MTKKQTDQFASAKKRLRKIEGLLGPYKKSSTPEPYSSRGKWRSGREVLTEQQKRGFRDSLRNETFPPVLLNGKISTCA